MLRKTDMRCGMWNVKSPYRAGSLKTVVKELSKYKLHLVGVQEVKWDRGDTESAGEYTFFNGKENENKFSRFFLTNKRILSVVKEVEFVSDRVA
jgi:hypothetical protein